MNAAICFIFVFHISLPVLNFCVRIKFLFYGRDLRHLPLAFCEFFIQKELGKMVMALKISLVLLRDVNSNSIIENFKHLLGCVRSFLQLV